MFSKEIAIVSFWDLVFHSIELHNRYSDLAL